MKNRRIPFDNITKDIERIKRYKLRIDNLKNYILANHLSFKYMWYFIFNKGKYKQFIKEVAEKIDYSSELDKLKKECKCDLYRIWTMWWQDGDMPIVVKKCIESMKKNSQYEVVVITKKNVQDYINIPDYILNSIDEGRMTFTHLSDYIRVSLIYEYGGLWLDSCIFVTKTLPKLDEYNIYSIKNNSVLYCGFCIGSNVRYHNFFGRTKLMMEAYWKNQKYLVDYFFMQYQMDRAIDDDENNRKLFLQLENNNEDFHFLMRNLSKPFLKEEWNVVFERHVFQKVSYKKPYKSKKNGMVTYGGKFFNKV